MSLRSTFATGKPIRGGVPICFPWFGPNAQNTELPAHGFARLQTWSLRDAEDLPDGRTRVRLALDSTPQTEALWPHKFSLVYTVTVGQQLTMELAVTNTDRAPIVVEEALHTYLDVGDVRAVRIAGLSWTPFVDKVDGGAQKSQVAAIEFTGETDRVFLGTTSTVEVEDRSTARRILVAKAGSQNTVVWNPWITKAARMPDFGDDEWPGMVCVESANVGDARITLAPGTSHTISQTLSVELLPR